MGLTEHIEEEIIKELGRRLEPLNPDVLQQGFTAFRHCIARLDACPAAFPIKINLIVQTDKLFCSVQDEKTKISLADPNVLDKAA